MVEWAQGTSEAGCKSVLLAGSSSCPDLHGVQRRYRTVAQQSYANKGFPESTRHCQPLTLSSLRALQCSPALVSINTSHFRIVSSICSLCAGAVSMYCSPHPHGEGVFTLVCTISFHSSRTTSLCSSEEHHCRVTPKLRAGRELPSSAPELHSSPCKFCGETTPPRMSLLSTQPWLGLITDLFNPC